MVYVWEGDSWVGKDEFDGCSHRCKNRLKAVYGQVGVRLMMFTLFKGGICGIFIFVIIKVLLKTP